MTRRTTRLTSNIIMQEAMLSCVGMYKPKYFLSANLGILNFAATVPTGITYMVTPQQMSVRRIPMTWFCEMANSVIGENGELLEYRHLIANQATRATWKHSYGNEIGQLAQGMPGRNTGTNTIIFIKKNQIPQDRAKDVIYGLITCLARPEKIDEPNRTRLVAGGGRVHYQGDAGTPTADLLTVKLLLNSIISTPNTKFMTMDIKDFYLNTPMARYEYMRLQIADMPEDVIAHYKLNEIATPEGYISHYWGIFTTASISTIKTQPQLRRILIEKLITANPQTNNKWRKPRLSAFQRLHGLWVVDRDLAVKY
jgi:hypothetical protein